MNQFNQFDISDVFNEVNDQLFIIECDEIIFFNRFFKENFIPISDSWRDEIEDDELIKSLDVFFETGKVPNTAFIPSIEPKDSDDHEYEWSFTNLPSSYSERFLIVRAHDMKSLSKRYIKEQETKEQLLRSEEKYRTLVEESTEIIFAVSDVLMINFISPNVSQFLGYDAENVIGTSIFNYLNPEDLDVFQSMTGEISEFLEQNQYLEFRIKHKNGDYRMFRS